MTGRGAGDTKSFSDNISILHSVRQKTNEPRAERKEGERERVMEMGSWKLELLLNTKKFHIGSCTAKNEVTASVKA